MQVLIWNWWNAHGLLRKRRKEEHITQDIMTYRVEVPWCKASPQGLLSFALTASEQTQNAEDVIDTLLFKCPQVSWRWVNHRFHIRRRNSRVWTWNFVMKKMTESAAWLDVPLPCSILWTESVLQWKVWWMRAWSPSSLSTL